MYCFFQCKKDDKQLNPVNIILYNQPLDTIKHYISGKWKFVYGNGGICSTCIHYCNNCYVEFTSDNKFISNTYAITSDTTTINWSKGIGIQTNGDSTFLMTFIDIQEVPHVYMIDQIYNDTLIYCDNAFDAVLYHFIKSK
jgi:disulfide oxidoreductase YuzD